MFHHAHAVMARAPMPATAAPHRTVSPRVMPDAIATASSAPTRISPMRTGVA
jgi:hypothetical protein